MGDKQPPGGYDSTPLRPSHGPTYTVKITFHRAVNLPISDFAARSSDPYVLAQINTDRPTRHSQDPRLRYRSPTVHHNVEPQWNAVWVVAGIPQSGFILKARVLDEDTEDADDRLGKVRIETGRIGEDWKGMHEEACKIRKTGANVRAYALRWCRTMVHRSVKIHGQMIISIEVLGRTKEEVGKVYTVNNFWRIHYSPLIGRLAGTKSSDDRGVERYNFQANEIQLQGPVPNELYHRFVDFKNFVGGMFQGSGPRGTLLNKALHHQHARVYSCNKLTKHGELIHGPGREMTLQFLDMVHFDQGARIFTYVITLDGLFRFTETGKEFGIDLLSKHTMHSDVGIYISWSGEFLIRRLAHPEDGPEDPNQLTHPKDNIPGGPPNAAPPKDPKYYELIIDNDSGTYRPNADLLPVLRKFLEQNFPDLKIVAKSSTDKELDQIKKDQKDMKSKEGDNRVYGQHSHPGSDAGSISSSDQENLGRRAQGDEVPQSKLEKGVAFLEKPMATVKGFLPGEVDKEQREKAETRDDVAAANSSG